jgi:glycosyltransferase involved in cell wall biosynthesis
LAKELGVRVAFYGACYDEGVLARLIMAACATVSPGKVGLTAMQSLAYGTPVITHGQWDAQGPEWEAVIPGKTGDLFKYGSSDDLARILRRWTQTVRASQDVREACIRLIERFYNPVFQRRAIDRAVAGLAADDLFWQRESEA